MRGSCRSYSPPRNRRSRLPDRARLWRRKSTSNPVAARRFLHGRRLVESCPRNSCLFVLPPCSVATDMFRDLQESSLSRHCQKRSVVSAGTRRRIHPRPKYRVLGLELSTTFVACGCRLQLALGVPAQHDVGPRTVDVCPGQRLGRCKGGPDRECDRDSGDGNAARV